jgi:drug/metabolite transporter (DMT)-like permease
MAASPAPTAEPLYRALQWLFGIDIVVGVVMMAGAEEIAPEWPGFAETGAGLALVGALLLFFFRRLAKRQAGREAKPGDNAD